MVSPRNDVWEESAEIQYWWRVTTQIWVATRLTQILTDTLIGKFRIPRGPWDEHDCEANAGQRL